MLTTPSNAPVRSLAVVAVMGFAVLTAIPTRASLITVEAAGSIYNFPEIAEDRHTKSGVTAASTTATADSPYGHAHGAASGLFDPSHSGNFRPFLTLHALATSTTSPESSPEINPGASFAQASFHDKVVIEDTLDFILHADPYLYFIVGIDGRFGGSGGSAHFEFRIGNRIQGYGLVEDNQRFRLEARLEDFKSSGVDYQLTLSASAVAGLGKTATADFFNTLTLGPLYIGDVNGNPIPGSESLVIRNEDGVVYPVVPIPEPASGGAFAVVAILLRRRRRNSAFPS